MRTSLNEIKQTEEYLHRQLITEEALVFEARLLTNPLLRLNVLAQKKVYQLIKQYWRKKLKREAEQLSERLFSDSGKREFQSTIKNLFNE